MQKQNKFLNLKPGRLAGLFCLQIFVVGYEIPQGITINLMPQTFNLM